MNYSHSRQPPPSFIPNREAGWGLTAFFTCLPKCAPFGSPLIEAESNKNCQPSVDESSRHEHYHPITHIMRRGVETDFHKRTIVDSQSKHLFFD